MFEFTGLVEMGNALEAAARAQLPRIGGALYRRGEAIMARSKEEFVPVDTGTLKSTGTVSLPTVSMDMWLVELSYGGPSAPYAATQHETPWFNHRVGQWKYLEQPLMEALPDIMPNIAADLRW